MKGYSLIELMVIVAIVAILTGVAVPTYMQYYRSSKLTSARTYLDSMDPAIKHYYLDNGIIPTNAQLNLTSTVPNSPSEYLYAPYLAYVEVGPQTTTSTQCTYGISTAYFSNYEGDFYTDGTSKYTVLYTYYVDNNGNMTKQCAYYEYDPVAGAPTTNQIFDDCILTNNPNSSEIMDLINTACD